MDSVILLWATLKRVSMSAMLSRTVLVYAHFSGILKNNIPFHSQMWPGMDGKVCCYPILRNMNKNQMFSSVLAKWGWACRWCSFGPSLISFIPCEWNRVADSVSKCLTYSIGKETGWHRGQGQRQRSYIPENPWLPEESEIVSHLAMSDSAAPWTVAH